MRLTCGGLGRTPQGGDLAPGGPLGAPSLCCPAGEGRVPLGLAHSSSPSSFCLPPSPSSCPPPPSSLLLPSLFFCSPHLGLTCPGLSFFIVLPSWLCVQDPSPWSRSLTAILSPSLLAWQLPITPGALTLLQALSSPSPVPALHGHLPAGILLPLENSQLRLLLCPSPCPAHL